MDLSKRVPERFPVYVRHVDTRVPYLEIANCKEDLPTEPNYVAQKIVEGEKIQYDFTFKDSEIVDRNSLIEADGYLTKIDFTSLTIEMAAESFKVESGKVMMETIGGVIFRVSISEF